MRYADFCGKQASVIALGTMDFSVTIEESKAFDFMDAYAALGGNFLDTARLYGNLSGERENDTERVVGDWLSARGSRGSIILSTKGGHPDLRTKEKRLDRANVLRDMQTSLEHLQTDHVDIYWLHRDDPERSVEEILTTLTELVERGMTKYVGVSNWTARRIAEANEAARAHRLVPIYADQPQFSLARQVHIEDPTLVQMDAELHAMHVQTGMPCVCFTSQAKGFLSKMAAGGEAALSDKAKRRYLCAENLALLERTEEIARRRGISVNAAALAYLTGQPFPCFPIAGASKLEQVLAIAEAGDAVLSPEEVAYLRGF